MSICLLDCAGWTLDMAQSQFHTAPALFVCTPAPCECFLSGCNGRLPSKFLCPRLPKKQHQKKQEKKRERKPTLHSSSLINLRKSFMWVAQQPAIYNPHHSGLALKKWQKCWLQADLTGLPVFLQGDKSTEDCHNSPWPISKRFSCLGIPVLMMYNLEDD